MNPTLTRLRDSGLNLQAVFNCESLPSDISEQIELAGGTPLHDCQVLLLGNGGTGFWEKLSDGHQVLNDEDDPIDRYVIETLEKTLNPPDLLKVVYPGNHFAPLTQLGKLCGWHNLSPLGLGIHEQYGLWFAYRALVLVTSQFEPSALLLSTDHSPDRQSPCQRCASKPCMTACPAAAVSDHGFEIKRCVPHRLANDSSCRSCCLARSACPVGTRYRYSTEQLAYHYQHSLNSIRKYQ